MKQRLNDDIKAALLRGDAASVEALRFLKSSMDAAEKVKGEELSEQEVVSLFRKEAKKREEAAGLFRSGGNEVAAVKEEGEARTIKGYLPEEMSEDAIRDKLIVIIQTNNISKEQSSMGKLMGLAKSELGDSADPSMIARIGNSLLRGES